MAIKKKPLDATKRQLRKGTNQSLPVESEQVSISEEAAPANARNLGGTVMESRTMLEELFARQREELAVDMRALVKESEGLVHAKIQTILNKNDDYFGKIAKSLTDMEVANKQRFEALNKRLEGITAAMDQLKSTAVVEPLVMGQSPSQTPIQTVVAKPEPSMVIESEVGSPEIKPRVVGLPDAPELQDDDPEQGTDGQPGGAAGLAGAPQKRRERNQPADREGGGR